MQLFRFRYSPYARKVQMLLDLGGFEYELIEVSYSNRTALIARTGGYAYVPVLVDARGEVLVESRDICEAILQGDAALRLTPRPLEGPIWAYADFADGPLEDVMFRIGSPAIRDSWKDPNDRALYILIKERKFGSRCVNAWEQDQERLLSRARHLLTPTIRTLEQQSFLFGENPTLADAALYGNCIMLEEGEPELLRRLSPVLSAYARRVEAAASTTARRRDR